MSAIPQHMNNQINHTRNESVDSDGVSRFSIDSDSESNETRNISPSDSSTSTMNNNSPSKKKRLCSVNFSRLKRSLRSLMWWRKKDKNDKNEKPILPISVEVKEKRKKRRARCLTILLVIIILLLLGNLMALDAVYFRSPVLRTNNITTLLNGNASEVSNSSNSPNAIAPAAQEQNFKAITCANMLSLPPTIFPCEFCLDDQSFYNVTQFCALKIMFNNAINQTALQVDARWMQDSNFCNWLGVTCDKSNNIIGLDLRFPNTVRTLDFSMEKLTTLQSLKISGDGHQFPNDVIPLGIFRFANLVEFSLVSTALSGSLPNTFDKMTSLKSLEFRSNPLLNGSLPESLSTTSLTTLVYNAQNVNSPFPDFIGNSKTLQSSLVFLDLGFNQFTGQIDSVYKLSNLRSLQLTHNLLTGEPFPSITSANFAKTLNSLDLSFNGFSGAISPSINQFPNLAFLNLQSNNAFTGQIPTEISSLTKLHDIFLNNNNLTGEIPSGIGNFNDLATLILSNNELTGPVPNSICKNYTNCILSQNQFNPAPVGCGNCLF